MAQIRREGQYGDTSAQQNIDFKVEENEQLTELIIRSGYLVDAIGFTKVDKFNKPRTQTFGGNGGHLQKIVFDRGENITGISLKYKDSTISKLKIYTDSNSSGYGPYGTSNLVGGKQFDSPPLKDNESIVGFIGAFANDTIAALGLYVQVD